MNIERQALVIGATGGIGGAVARALIDHGWVVRGLTRDPSRAASTGPLGISWELGDAMQEADVVRAARSVSLVLHAANPPGYRNWRELGVPMLRNAIAAARAADARLVFPGNLYIYGPNAEEAVNEDAPRTPLTTKGRIRLEMEAMLQAASTHGLRTLVVRSGDVFGPHAPSSWMTSVLLRNGRPLHAITTPEMPGVRHAWAYLPDFAETVAQLADREDQLPHAECLHFSGHCLEGREMAEAVRRVVDFNLPIRPFPWWQVVLGMAFSPFLRELNEMRYLWRVSLSLDNTRLVERLGIEPHTPLDEAVRASLDGLRKNLRRDGTDRSKPRA